jgi:hypothetical protein
MKSLVVATATDKTLPRTYSGRRQKVVAHNMDLRVRHPREHAEPSGRAPDERALPGLQRHLLDDHAVRGEVGKP